MNPKGRINRADGDDDWLKKHLKNLKKQLLEPNICVSRKFALSLQSQNALWMAHSSIG